MKAIKVCFQAHVKPSEAQYAGSLLNKNPLGQSHINVKPLTM